MAETLFNVILGTIMAAYLFFALRLPATDNPSDVLGAGGFPIIVVLLGLAALAVLTVKRIRSKGGERVHVFMFDLKTPDGRTLVLNVALLAAYVFLLELLGFTLSTLLYLPAAATAIGYRRWGRLAVFVLVLTAAIVVVFGKVFYVPLPRGAGFLRELSFLLY